MEARYCIEECVYKGVGLLDESSTELNHERLIQEFKRGVAGAGQWGTVMDEAINVCTGSSGQESSDSSCSEIPHAFTRCLIRQLFLNCPADKWNNSAECNLVKDRMQVCPNIPPPPPIQHRPHNDSN
uniref:Putative odorant-binding protein n=1 Tax=Triatoma brasiliensis TaxID=65344 RepID=A0A162X6E0_TRIBS|nr:putative odorant-binding protein [Triatoma brasiliensis]